MGSDSDSTDESPARQDTTVRIVKSGPLQELSEDPVERYQHHFVHQIERNLPPLESPVIGLDLACGVGFSTLSMVTHLPPGSRIVGIGDDRADLKVFHEQLTAEQRHLIFPLKEPRDRLPFAANVFDLVWGALSSDQLDPLRAILRQALRVLRPGGHLLLAAPLRATFVELANAISPSLQGFSNTEAFHALMSEPPQLLGADGWQENLQRCGAMEVTVIRDTVEINIAPPLSAQPLFARHLLPLWLGDNPTLQARALRLLDDAVEQPLAVTIHVGCIVSRRGAEDIADESVT